ncbi:hypothetical protein HY990_01080 [Candidatus Micrarchaeota archaeon]|nr:hypothetical protein [Candidatus Micrarchaeota archaeon]
MSKSVAPPSSIDPEPDLLDKIVSSFSHPKKLLYGVSLLLGILGFFILILVGLLGWNFLNQTQDALILNVDRTVELVSSTHSILSTFDQELNSTNVTLSKLSESFSPLSASLMSTSDSISSISSVLSSGSAFGIGFGSSASSLSTAASQLRASSISFSNVSASFDSHKQNLANLTTDLTQLRSSISALNSSLIDTKARISGIFDTLRLVLFLLILLFTVMFAVQSLNSLAGIL